MIRRLWSNLVRWGWEYEREFETMDSSYTESIDIPTSFRLDVSLARGGVVVVVRRQGILNIGRGEEIVHVLPNCDDVAQAIGEIAAMEMLKT